MGVYQYTDPQTQRSYNFSIADDVPSEEDFAKIRQYLDTERADYGQKYQNVFGEEFDPDGEMAVRRSLRRGYQGLKEGIGEAIGTAGEQAGLGFLANFGQSMEDKAQQRQGALSLEQPTPLQSTDVDSIGTALTYAGEVVGQQLPQLGLGLGAAALGSALAPAAPFVAGAVTAGVATAPVLFGNNIQRQEDLVATGKKDKVDVGAALKATFGQAALEGVADKILLGGLLRPLGKSIFTKTLSRATGGTTTEGLTEVGQQILERSQAGLPIDSEDAIAEYREAAIAGGLIGGGTRATFGAFQGTDTTTDKDDATTDTETTPPVVTEVDAAAEKKAKADADKKAAEDAAAELEVKTDAQKKEEDNAADPTPPEGKAEETELDRAAATAAVATDTDRAAAIAKEEANKVKTAENKTQKFIDEVKAENVETPAEFIRKSEDRAAAIESEQTGEQIEVKKQETVVETAENTIDDEFLAGLNVPTQALIRREKGKKSLIGKSRSDPETIQALRDYVSVSSIPEAREGVQSYLDTLEVADAETDTTGVGGSVEGSGPSVVGGTGVRSGVESTEDVTPSDDAGLGGDLQPTDRAVVPTTEQSDALTEMADRATATPVQAELFSGLPEDTRGAVRDTQGPLPNVIPEGQPTLPLQQPEGVGPRGLNIPPSPAGVSTAGQATGAAGQVIPAGVQVPATSGVVGASVPQEQLQAAEAQRLQAAQARIDRIFDNNRGKQPQRREYHNTQLDPRVSPDIGTALDKEAVADLVETSDENLKGMDDAIAARIFFKRFRRPVDAVAEIGSVLANGPTQQALESDVIAGGKTKKKSKKDEEAEKGRFYYTPKDFAFYEGMTQQNATKAAEWVDENMSQALSNELSAAYDLTARDTSPFNPRADSLINLDRAIKSIGKDDDKQETELAGQEIKEIVKSAEQKADQEAKPVTLVPTPWTKNNNLKLLIDPTYGLDQALLPSIRNALQRGDLKFALEAIASTSNVRNIRRVASEFINVVGDTRVQVVPDLSQEVGRTAAGLFSPETNTIVIDANRGMNVHTVLHEMAHATTSASLANPSLPTTKQLQRMLDSARIQLGEVYGTQNLDEFVAESFSNPEFRSALVLSRLDGTSMYSKFVDTITKIVRRVLGLPASGNTAQMKELDRLITGLLAPSPATRAVPDMYLLQNIKKGATDLLRTHVTSTPLENKNTYERARDLVSANTPRVLKKAVLNLQPINNLARLAKDKIPFANELNVLIDQQSGTLRNAFQPIDVIFNDYKAYKKANAKGYARMQALMNRATQDEVDPARPRSFYSKYLMSYYDMKAEKTIIKEFGTAQDRDAEIQRLNNELEQDYVDQDLPRSKAKKAGDPSNEKTAVWDTLNKEYKLLGEQGQYLYKVTRNMGEAAQDRIMPAIKARIASLGIDAQAQKTAFEKLSELLHAQGGVIRPYFKLGRDGDYRLSYHAPDPLRNGSIELFTEYYTTEKDLMQAQENVTKYLQDIGRSEDINKIESGKRDAQRNYDRAPSSSFVFDVLSTLQVAGVDQASIDRIIDLSLDAIPERSFMQSFRSRKERSEGNRGILGALGDVTPSGMPGMEVDPAQRFRDNFRSIEKQLVQLEFGAKIQGFRNKLKDGGYFTRLDTADMAEKVDQIAKFAQAPSMARWSQVATSMGFAWTMGANISSALNIMFDVPMAVHPYLAGEYGGRKATRAIADATKLFMGSPSTKMITLMGADGRPETREVKLGQHNKGFDNYNFDDPNLDPKIRMHKTLVEKAGTRGMFNQSIDQEHIDLSDRRDVTAKLSQVSGFLVHHGERFGRQISLIAANELELNKLTGGTREPTQAEYDIAADKAMAATELTLGSTASAGRPIWAQNPVGNVAFLFKRFAVSRYYFMSHLLDQALAGADPETRKIARHQLAYFMITTGALAGVGGLPMMGAIGAIYNAFADDDEDEFEAMLRKILPSSVYDGLANEILGIDVASRVSMNSLLYRQPFIDKDQSAFFTLFEQLGGPVVGMFLSAERGFNLIQEGEFQRGFEAAAPALFRNISKAERFSTEGATTLRGNPIVDDINPYNAFMQGLGFAPADYVENLKKNSNERRRQNAVDSKRRKLLRKYNMARVEGDSEGVAQALQNISGFNSSLPEVFRKDSFIDSTTLKKSYKTFVRTTGKMINGIVYTDAMRKSAEDYK